MVNEIYDKIRAGEDVRANLIALKQEIREDIPKRALAYHIAGDYGMLTALLEHEDPKVRKNSALILGEMEDEELANSLFEAYQRETQKFVRSSYLKALSHYDYQQFLPMMKEQISGLEEESGDKEGEKHRREELQTLRSMVLRYEKPPKHIFEGTKGPVEVILLTNRNHREVTRRQLPEGEVKMLAGGIRLTTEDLNTILPIRTYSELLFPVKKTGLISDQPEKAAEQLAASDLLPMLKRFHQGEAPFYYRVEQKSKMPMEKKSSFLKKLTAKLDQATGQALINSPTNYEAEVRLVENKEGSFIPLLKLYTLEDERFSYRRQKLSTSITPVNAALFMQLAGEYLKEGAQVLDPFCGTGTMLIERSRFGLADPLYGIDIFEEAVIKGRENAEAAGLVIHFINRDFFDFQHEYLFDEIVSNLPGVTRTKDKGEILFLYENLFKKAPLLLKEDGRMFLYTSEPDLILCCLKDSEEFELLESWMIQDKDGSTFFAVQRRSE